MSPDDCPDCGGTEHVDEGSYYEHCLVPCPNPVHQPQMISAAVLAHLRAMPLAEFVALRSGEQVGWVAEDLADFVPLAVIPIDAELPSDRPVFVFPEEDQQ